MLKIICRKILIILTTGLIAPMVMASGQGTLESEREFKRLLSGDKKARVIVKLKSPASKKSKRERLGGGQWMSLGSYIDEAQQKLAKEMGWVNFNDIVRFKEVPAVAKSIDASEFSRLQQSDLVESVFEDRFNELQLERSHKTIGMGQVPVHQRGGKGTTVAVVDTGVEYNHPFFQDRVVDGACFSGYKSCPNRQTKMMGREGAIPCKARGCDHGTHVAGIVAGKGRSMSGVAPEANLLAVNVFSTDGRQLGAFDSDIIQGLEWVYLQAERQNVVAVNMSLGGGYFKAHCDQSPSRVIIEKLAAKGVATVVAAGNESKTDGIAKPACISQTISVGSIEPNGQVSSFSNSYRYLDMMAPGGQINSAITGSSFARKSGTSMAAPQVAGAIAVLKSVYADADVEQLTEALQNGSVFRDPRNGVRTPSLHVPTSLAFLEGVSGNNRRRSPRPEPQPEPEEPSPDRYEPEPSKPRPEVPKPEKPKPEQPKPQPKKPKPKKKCSERIDGILVEKKSGDCKKAKKIEW